ncbi:ABC transporter ATP-binding protein [Thiobacillus sp.]|uniref:ABC transporter ATP-binding protein n=1 Tax=Thiobacillus sp. TaxID=924 RepID=UPI001ACA6DBA|nr:ABC transporter ATP-binding protein [Thiobacillus sp.]MBN8778098.1 ABC transporter ATP-binding protein [Thiobacillus sp.]
MNQATPAIHVDDLRKRFRTTQALDGVSLDIQPGEFFGLLGPNGAGKTTLISILAGLTRADSGQAAIMGHDVVRDYRQARRALGVVPQELVYDPFFNVRETLRIQSGYFGLKHNDGWIDEIMHHLDLAQHADKNTQNLSGGMKRRLLVAQALVHKPPVIVLDEPTAGVDVDLRRSLWEFISRLNREGHTILLTTHYLEEAEALCGRIAMLKSGRVVACDTTRNLLQLTNEHCAQLRLDRDDVPVAWRDRLLRDAEGSWRINFSEYLELETLLADLRGAGVRVTEMHLQEPDLEDVFTDIMKRT